MKEIDGWAAKESKWVDEMEWKQLVEWMNKFICSWMKLMRQWNGINERGPKELTLRGKPTPAPINLSLWRRLMELAAELLLFSFWFIQFISTNQPRAARSGLWAALLLLEWIKLSLLRWREKENEQWNQFMKGIEWNWRNWFVNEAKNGTTSKLSFNNQFIDWGREVRQWSEWAEWRGSAPKR